MNTLMVLMGVAVLFISMEVSLAALTDLDPCLENSDCSDVAGAGCVRYDGCNNGTCKCMDDYTEVEGACKANKAKDEGCDTATDVCNSNLECSTGETPTCTCPTDTTWDTTQNMCFAADAYVALEGTCTGNEQCYAHDDDNEAAYICRDDDTTDNDNSMKCACADNYFADDATKKCWKRSYEGDCTVGDAGSENIDCMPSLVCRDDNGTNKCLCAAAVEGGAAAEKWNSKTMMCVADGDADLAEDANCEANQCGADLTCTTCPLETDMKCRSLMSGGGSGGSSEETSGAAHLAAGVATIILSAVAMFL